MVKHPEELPYDTLYKVLLSFYSIKYPNNPDGILNVHIDRKVREGLTEHEAAVLLSKQIPDLEKRVESLPKEFSEPIEETFQARYVGGHPLHPNPRGVKICLRTTALDVPELQLVIPYAKISNIESVTQEEVEFAWMKERKYLHVSFSDQVGMNHNVIFDVENVEKVVPAIYQRVVNATRKQAETEKQRSVTEPVVREKEIIREKEVIYKVKCPYCGKLYNEVLDVCPHCGGKR
jgi:hypothetical protein